MKSHGLALAIFTAAALVAAQTPVSVAASPTKVLTQKAPQQTLQLKARSSAEVKRSFGFAAGQRSQAIEISCSPGGSEHCSGDFVTACDNHDGGMSTNPDGSVTCSLPQHD